MGVRRAGRSRLCSYVMCARKRAQGWVLTSTNFGFHRHSICVLLLVVVMVTDEQERRARQTRLGKVKVRRVEERVQAVESVCEDSKEEKTNKEENESICFFFLAECCGCSLLLLLLVAGPVGKEEKESLKNEARKGFYAWVRESVGLLLLAVVCIGCC